MLPRSPILVVHGVQRHGWHDSPSHEQKYVLSPFSSISARRGPGMNGIAFLCMLTIRRPGNDLGLFFETSNVVDRSVGKRWSVNK